MADTRMRTRKATLLLKGDHQTVKKLFADFEKLEEEDKDRQTEIYDLIRKELTVHSQIEEEIFYPAIQAAQDDEADELVREAHEEHRLVKQLLEEIGQIGASDDQFCAKMKVLKDTVLHHAEEEQDEIFPIFDDLDKAEQNRISEQLAERKAELTETMEEE